MIAPFRKKPVRKLLLAPLAMAALLPVAAAPAIAASSHALIQGSGSSWSSNAINQWVADVEPTGLQVVFTASGSAQGRKDYAYRTTDFAVSDIGYLGTDPVTQQSDTSQGRAYAYLPVVAGGTAFPYQVKVGGKLVRNIRLSGETLTRIFTLKITNWNDPAISKDNNGRVLPSLSIIPVVHSEGSGSTAQFTRYLDTLFPSLWRTFFGKNGPTEYYPSKSGMIAQNGSDGVMNFVASSAANGAIGYDEYSYALGKDYPVIKLGNAARYYTAPTQYNVAVALTTAKINLDRNSPNYLLQDLTKVYSYSDPRAYPMSSYSYLIIPTASDDPRMTTAKRQTLADFLNYSVCEGQAEMGPIGYSPLPINLAQASFDQVAKLKAADKAVDISRSDVTKCNNPTFIKGQPTRNYLAEIAPKPLSCDAEGAGPCTANAGIVNNNPGGKSGSGGSVSGAQGGPTGGSSSTGGAGTGGSTSTTGSTKTATGGAGILTKGSTSGVTPPGSTGAGTSASGSTAGASTTDLAASPTELSSESGASAGMGLLAVALLLAGLIAPPILAQRLKARA